MNAPQVRPYGADRLFSGLTQKLVRHQNNLFPAARLPIDRQVRTSFVARQPNFMTLFLTGAIVSDQAAEIQLVQGCISTLG